MYGVLEMLKTEKSMSGFEFRQLFAKHIKVATGECVASYVKEVNYTGVKSTAKFSDFQVGTYKVTRSFAKEVPHGTEYIFIKPIKSVKEIVFFPLSKIYRTERKTNDFVSKQIKSKIVSGTKEDFNEIFWENINGEAAKRFGIPIWNKEFPKFIVAFVFFFIPFYSVLGTMLYLVCEPMIKASKWHELIFSPVWFLVFFFTLISVIFLTVVVHVCYLWVQTHKEEISVARGECVEYEAYRRPGRSSYSTSHAVFAVGKLKVRIELTKTQYDNICKGKVYLIAKPRSPKGMWVGLPEEDVLSIMP